MKKFTILLLTITIANMTCAFASEYTKFSRKFIKHFKDCDAYEETVTSRFEDNDFTTKRKIHGWKNGLCKYSEVITSRNSGYMIDCQFTEVQLDDLYDAMKDKSKKAERFNLDLYEPQIDKKTNETTYVRKGFTIIKGNKAYIEWAKYQNNPYFCKSERIK